MYIHAFLIFDGRYAYPNTFRYNTISQIWKPSSVHLVLDFNQENVRHCFMLFRNCIQYFDLLLLQKIVNIKRFSMYLSSAISEKLISDTSHTLTLYLQRKLCNSTFKISLLSFYKVHRTDTFLLCELFRLKNAKKKLLIVLVKMPRTSDIVVTWSLFQFLV